VTAPHPILAQLVALDTLKTWSLIVTLFGDLDEDELSGTQIRTLLGHIGIKPEAIRVALHRLKSDGWITSTRRGREAIYRMSQMAQSETATVAPKIYHATNEAADAWCFVLCPEAQMSKDAIPLNRNLAVVPVKGWSDSDALVLTPDRPLPPWVAASLVSDGLVQLAGDLGSMIGRYADLSADLDRTLFRLLVLHHWRRIALRSGSWAHASFLPDGPIARCRVDVVAFLEHSPKISS